MAVTTDAAVAALRSYLSGDIELSQQLHLQLFDSGQDEGYGELLYAAFITALRRRFAPRWTRPAIIRFVADVRSRLGEDSHLIDPTTAENLIRRALDDPVDDSATAEAKAQAQLLLLTALIEDEELTERELDQFLDEVRTLADDWRSRDIG